MSLSAELKRRFLLTCEVQVSSESDVDSVLAALEPIKGRIDGLIPAEVEVKGVSCDSVSICRTLSKNGHNPLFETTTRDKNRLELQSQLLDAGGAGIYNILAFTRDYRITGDSLNEMMFFHVDSGKLFSVLDSLKEGVDVKGKDLPKIYTFSVGAGIEAGWGGNVPDLEMREIERLAEMGTEYFVTTPVFDLSEFSRFCDRVKQFGIPVMAEVILARTADMCHVLNKYYRHNLVPPHVIERLSKAPDKEKASIEIFAELVTGLKGICQGIHVVPLGAEEHLSRYLRAVWR